jgi:hypothetical protein
MTRMTAAQS